MTGEIGAEHRMTRYCFDKEPVADFTALCRRLTGKALQSPYRSTVPLLSLVEHSQPDWHALLGDLGAPPDSTVHFEYCVPSPKPGGNPFQTEWLLCGSHSKMASGGFWPIADLGSR